MEELTKIFLELIQIGTALIPGEVIGDYFEQLQCGVFDVKISTGRRFQLMLRY